MEEILGKEEKIKIINKVTSNKLNRSNRFKDWISCDLLAVALGVSSFVGLHRVFYFSMLRLTKKCKLESPALSWGMQPVRLNQKMKNEIENWKCKNQAHCLVGQPGLTMWNQRILFWTFTLVHPRFHSSFHSQLVRPDLENIVNHPMHKGLLQKQTNCTLPHSARVHEIMYTTMKLGTF